MQNRGRAGESGDVAYLEKILGTGILTVHYTADAILQEEQLFRDKPSLEEDNGHRLPPCFE